MINKIMKGNIYHELLIDFGYAINISDYLWEIKKFFFSSFSLQVGQQYWHIQSLARALTDKN